MTEENSTSQAQDTVVRNDVGKRRFIIDVAGEQAGFAEYEQFEGLRDFIHTEIAEEFGGRGLANILVQQALDETIDEGLKFKATCPLVRHFVKKHPEYQSNQA